MTTNDSRGQEINERAIGRIEGSLDRIEAEVRGISSTLAQHSARLQHLEKIGDKQAEGDRRLVVVETRMAQKDKADDRRAAAVWSGIVGVFVSIAIGIYNFFSRPM